MSDLLKLSRRKLITSGLLLTAFAVYLLCGGTLQSRGTKRDGWESGVGAHTQYYSAKEFPICFGILEASCGLLASIFFYAAYKKGKDAAQ
jgi:hypothetical protein